MLIASILHLKSGTRQLTTTVQRHDHTWWARGIIPKMADISDSLEIVNITRMRFAAFSDSGSVFTRYKRGGRRTNVGGLGGCGKGTSFRHQKLPRWLDEAQLPGLMLMIVTAMAAWICLSTIAFSSAQVIYHNSQSYNSVWVTRWLHLVNNSKLPWAIAANIAASTSLAPWVGTPHHVSMCWATFRTTPSGTHTYIYM